MFLTYIYLLSNTIKHYVIFTLKLKHYSEIGTEHLNYIKQLCALIYLHTFAEDRLSVMNNVSLFKQIFPTEQCFVYL